MTAGPIDRLRELHAAVVSDALDSIGLRHQTCAPGIARLGAAEQVVGRAATLDVRAVDVVPESPYRLQFEAVDALQPGDIVVVNAPEVASAFWGELITIRAQVRGAVGAVVDGYVRDLAGIRSRGFGMWARGTHPGDSLGRLDAVAFGTTVEFAGVTVCAGDYVIADLDGIVFIPAGRIDEVLRLAEAKHGAEQAVQGDLSEGATVVETYDRHGVM